MGPAALQAPRLTRLSARHDGADSGTNAVKAELWIGMVHLRPVRQGIVDYAGAYTHIVTWVADASGFQAKAEEVAATVDMYVLEVEWAKPVGSLDNWLSSEELSEMILGAQSNSNFILFGTFHTYLHDEA